MSYHKARPDAGRPDPTQPTSTVMYNGRYAGPHAEVDGKPILGGLHNAIVEGEKRTPEEEKAQVQDYHKNREQIKKAHAEYFDPKTGEPKPKEDEYVSDAAGDAVATPAVVAVPVAPTASPEEVKKNAEAEKKATPKVDEKK